MNFIDKALQAVGLTRLKESEGLSDTDSDGEDSHLYRPITGYNRQTGKFDTLIRNPGVRELSSYIQARQHQIAYALWVRNPLARQIIRLMEIFTVGPYWETSNPQVEQILTEHDQDLDNDWDGEKDKLRARELSMFGEQCYPIGINPINGKLKLGYLDSTNLLKIGTSELNNMLIEKIYYSSTMTDPGGNYLMPVRYDEDGSWGTLVAKEGIKKNSVGKYYQGKDTKGRYVGECFYFAINKVIAATRGTSDLLPTADWIDSYGEMLFTQLDRAHLMNNFIWDITIENASKSAIQQFLKEMAEPNPGEVRAHNEKVKWEAVTPQFNSADMKGISDLIKSMILIGGNFPPHWFADGTSTNKATAQEMGLPTLEMLKDRRKTYAKIKETIYQTQIDTYELFVEPIKREPDKEKDPLFTMVIPSLTEKAMNEYSAAITQILNGLAVAESYGWITKDSAAKVAKSIIDELGTEVDIPEELKEQTQKGTGENAIITNI